MSWSVDGIPVASQLKAGFLYYRGETEAAKEVQDNFTKRCPVVAQARWGVEKYIIKDERASNETYKSFVDNAQKCFDRAGEATDAIPVVSQIKSVVKAMDGDVDGAYETQNKFTQRCPIVAQIRAATESALGNSEGSENTKKEFDEHTWQKIDTVPVVGHVAGLIEYPNDPSKGSESISKANETVSNMLTGIKESYKDMVSNSSGSGLTGDASLRRWERVAREKGSSRLVGVDAAPLQICTTLLASAHSQGCQICMENFEDGELVRILPCMHMFHGGDTATGEKICIDKWLDKSTNTTNPEKNQCPMCRKEIIGIGDPTEQM